MEYLYFAAALFSFFLRFFTSCLQKECTDAERRLQKEYKM
jgi:hypothetical protein